MFYKLLASLIVLSACLATSFGQDANKIIIGAIGIGPISAHSDVYIKPGATIDVGGVIIETSKKTNDSINFCFVDQKSTVTKAKKNYSWCFSIFNGKDIVTGTPPSSVSVEPGTTIKVGEVIIETSIDDDVIKFGFINQQPDTSKVRADKRYTYLLRINK